VHAVAPFPALALPGGHGAHASASLAAPVTAPNEPAAHTEAHDDCARSGLKVDGGHGAHVAFDVAPTAAEKVPVAHAMHAAAPLALENEPAGHGRHADASDAPCSALYEPALQFEQAPTLTALMAAPHVPAGHGTAMPTGQ